MENKPQIQNKIRFDKFFVEQMNFNCINPLVKNDFNEELEIGLKVSSAFNEKETNSYLINMELEVKANDDSLNIFCKAVGLFETAEVITEDFKQSFFVTVNSPAILFPFIRSYINTISSNSGIPPIILPSINFSK